MFGVHIEIQKVSIPRTVKTIPRTLNNCQMNSWRIYVFFTTLNWSHASICKSWIYLFWNGLGITILLSDRRRLGKLSLFYSIQNKSAPDYLCDLMPLPVCSVSQYDLQNSNYHVLPNCRLEMTKKSFFPSAIRNWNNPSPEIRNSGYTYLKEKLKYYLKNCLFISVGVIEI